jgi:RNA polymerase sigma-70 factor, ECF subfamily
VDSHIRQQMVTLLPRLRRFAHGLTGTAADGDDLVQATCERAIGNLDKWRPGTRLDSWMFRIAQNLHINTVRDRKNRERILSSAADTIAPATTAAGAAESRTTWVAVRRCLEALPAEQRSVLLLICVEGYSYAECATILDVPVGTVTSRLARGRETLQARLSDDNEMAQADLRRTVGK